MKWFQDIFAYRVVSQFFVWYFINWTELSTLSTSSVSIVICLRLSSMRKCFKSTNFVGPWCIKKFWLFSRKILDIFRGFLRVSPLIIIRKNISEINGYLLGFWTMDILVRKCSNGIEASQRLTHTPLQVKNQKLKWKFTLKSKSYLSKWDVSFRWNETSLFDVNFHFDSFHWHFWTRVIRKIFFIRAFT